MRVTFESASDEGKREVPQNGVCNPAVVEVRAAFYQWKGPFALLEQESSGAFLHPWWT